MLIVDIPVVVVVAIVAVIVVVVVVVVVALSLVLLLQSLTLLLPSSQSCLPCFCTQRAHLRVLQLLREGCAELLGGLQVGSHLGNTLDGSSE